MNSRAALISLNNPSFESPDLAPGNFTFTAQGWSQGLNFGTFNAGDFGQTGTAPHGGQVAFVNVQNGEGWQTTGTSFQSATSYLLNFFISARQGPGTSDMTVVVFKGSIVSGLVDLNASNVVTLDVFDAADGVVADTFLPFSLTVTPAQVAAANAAGQPISIGFFGGSVLGFGNTNNTAGDFDIDNVSLQSTAVPEPSASLLAIAAMFTAMRRRR